MRRRFDEMTRHIALILHLSCAGIRCGCSEPSCRYLVLPLFFVPINALQSLAQDAVLQGQVRQATTLLLLQWLSYPHCAGTPKWTRW